MPYKKVFIFKRSLKEKKISSPDLKYRILKICIPSRGFLETNFKINYYYLRHGYINQTDGVEEGGGSSLEKTTYRHFSGLDLLQSPVFMGPMAERRKGRACIFNTINIYGGRSKLKREVQLWGLTGVISGKWFSCTKFRLRASFIFPSGFSPFRSSGRSQKVHIHSKSDCGYPRVPGLWEQSESQPRVFGEKAKGQAHSEEPDNHCCSPKKKNCLPKLSSNPHIQVSDWIPSIRQR